ncbi:UDP-2,4-diacetamido-2,4,6-trideoxy-beta-L-altropyranose hydrolase [Halopseudomonas laoshanensis]|uniref:UDP-2,4-diacetamido-2,4, 6-trideoxy-beta-L-altropyranose hydrolase n=1 Tax=Halopseudomonas laoshanensis TaxID=2268758 RepID=A0A7V7GN76_9GAMM|nr:UDP-2,4-diacetamido-2,4,6-trideoxy-beta-L-altropyranose hydrolase [Halopseudomonas laoshanensis]KAA0690838.1 UDP-2,4-diacetamido-2,4,6-trideoxy-beta-L-altropyranose hydrolase [Halopseudomonas laoshanensis]
MNVAFRVDASLEMGTGHVMRCLTLANELAAQGAKCHFICREHAGNLISFIRNQGHAVTSIGLMKYSADPASAPPLPLAHAAWLGSTQESDAEACMKVLARLRPRWVIVDNYALDARWEQMIKPCCGGVLVIDDLADRAHDCDLLLDQTLGRDIADYEPRVPGSCVLLCGSEYALLRPEFAEHRHYSLERRRDAKIENILVSMGGVDRDNATGKVLSALASALLPADCVISVVMGSNAPWVDAINKQATNMPVTTVVKSAVSNMAQLMAQSDLAIGAAGATSWERCCLGLPSIMIVLAANQKAVASGLRSAEAAEVVPAPHAIIEMVPTLVGRFLQSPCKLMRMSISAASVTDGKGVYRLTKHMI